MADVALDRLLGEVEPVADLSVHESFRDELEHLDLAGRGGVFRFRGGRACREVDELSDWRPTRRDRLKALRVFAVAHKDLVSLSGVHVSGIGGARELL
jgi:hypothetical protein